MNKWRNWRIGLEYYDKKRDAVLFGTLDDCLINDDHYIPFDYVKGFASKDGDSEILSDVAWPLFSTFKREWL